MDQLHRLSEMDDQAHERDKAIGDVEIQLDKEDAGCGSVLLIVGIALLAAFLANVFGGWPNGR